MDTLTLDDVLGKQKGGSNPPPSSTNNNSPITMDQVLGTQTTTPAQKSLTPDNATLGDFINPIKKGAEWLGDKIVEQTKKDILLPLNIAETAANQVTALGAGMASFPVSIPGRIPIVRENFPKVTKFLTDLADNTQKMFTYQPTSVKGKELTDNINSVVEAYVNDFSSGVEKIMLSPNSGENQRAIVRIGGELSAYAFAGGLIKELKTAGIPEEVAKNVADKVTPREAGVTPSKGLPVDQIENAPVDYAGIVNNLDKVKSLTIPKEEQLNLNLNPEAKTFVNKSGGMSVENPTSKVIGVDIDGVFSNETGFDPAKVALFNQEMERLGNPDLVVGSSHRQASLLLGSLEDIQQELRDNGIKSRVAGVTPDFDADMATPNVDGSIPTRGSEYVGWQKEFGDRLGAKITAVLDDRTDLTELGDKHIQINNGLGLQPEHIAKLDNLFTERTPTVQELAQRIGEFDPLLKQHGENVGSIAAKISDILGLPENIQHEIVHGSWIHDLGKLDISKEILDSTSKLTPTEFEQIKNHPISGWSEALKDKLSPVIQNIISNHHEKFDGSGYPEGLKGKEIPIEAQIVSAADVYDALTTKDRSYRRPLSQAQLLATFDKMRGMNFDPKIVDALFQAVGLKSETVSKVIPKENDVTKTPFEEPIARKGLQDKIKTLVENIKEETLSPNEVEIKNNLVAILSNERGSFSTSPIDPVSKTLKERKLANDQLREEYIKIDSLAKKEKISIEEFLAKTEMTPEEIKDFLVIGKDLTKGDSVYARSMGREIGQLKTALGLTTKELELLNKEISGVSSYKDMSIGDKQQVLKTLQYLYKAKNGIDFQMRKQNRIPARKQKLDADRAYVENSLSPRGLFGLREVTDRMVSDGDKYLREHGPSAKKLAETISTIKQMSDLRYAELMANKKLILGKLKEEDLKRVQEIVSTINTSDIPKLHDSKEVRAAASFIRNSFNSIGEDMEINNVKITKLNGNKETYIHDPEKPYWPRYYNSNELLNPGRKHDAAIRQIIKKGYADTPGQAEVLLDKLLSRRMNAPKYGNMEYAREFDVDGYETDIHKVFDNYFQSSAKRIEVIKAYGQEGKGALELLGNIKKESGDYVYKYAIDINKRVMGGNYGNDQVGRAVVDTVTGLEVLTKMGRAGIRNLGQSANTFGISYTKSAAKALAHIFSDPREVFDRAERSAAMLHSYAQNFAAFERGEEVSVGFLKAAKIEEKVVDKFLTYTGFKHSEIFNRLFAAETGREYAVDLFRDLKKAPIGSRSYRMASMRIEKLGIDPMEALNQTELNEFQRRTAAYNFVRQTQFVNDAMSLPRWVSTENPWMRMLTLFKTFSMQQAKLVYRTIKTDPVMGAKLIGSMTIFGALTAEAIDQLTGKVRNDETALEQVSRYIASGGGFGIWADTVQNSMRSSTGLSQAVAGPVAGDLGTKIYGLKRGLADDDWGVFQKTMIRDIPFIGSTVINLQDRNIKW